MDIKKGDVVKLKSGGPNMTVMSVVETVSGDTTIYCKWFTSVGMEWEELREDNFAIEALVKNVAF